MLCSKYFYKCPLAALAAITLLGTPALSAPQIFSLTIDVKDPSSSSKIPQSGKPVYANSPTNFAGYDMEDGYDDDWPFAQKDSSSSVLSNLLRSLEVSSIPYDDPFDDDLSYFEDDSGNDIFSEPDSAEVVTVIESSANDDSTMSSCSTWMRLPSFLSPTAATVEWLRLHSMPYPCGIMDSNQPNEKVESAASKKASVDANLLANKETENSSFDSKSFWTTVMDNKCFLVAVAASNLFIVLFVVGMCLIIYNRKCHNKNRDVLPQYEAVPQIDAKL